MVNIKQRIIGGLVLLLAIVVFLPLLLHHQEKAEISNLSEMPIASLPKTSTKPLSGQILLVNEATPPVLNKPHSDALITQLKPSSHHPVAKGQGLNSPSQARKVSWIVQLGVFRHKKNAKQLIAKLQGLGIKTSEKKISIHHHMLYQVVAGPVEHYETAKQLNGRIKSHLHSSGLIKRG